MADLSRLVLEIDSDGVVTATGNLKKFSEAAGSTEKQTTKLDEVMNMLSPSTLAAVAGVTSLIKTVRNLTGAFSSAMSVYSEFESMQKGLETFYQDSDLGREKFEELRKLSNETTFGVDELAGAFTRLANSGADVDSINSRLVSIGNIAGGNKQKFSDIVSIYSKILSVGKAGSEQLEMLALRGVPIQSMLSKMGVTGTASASDITAAFEEMTQKGGQFYNAMNDINDTIEGKQGFISDYFKEFTVNLVELTGLADKYKKGLDFVKEGIGAMSDKLLELNSNPVAKAIIQGVLIGAVTAIGGAIIASVIPALMKVVAQLKIIAALKAITDTKGFLIGAGIAAAAGVALGMVTSIRNIAAAEDEVNRKLDEQIKKRDTLRNSVRYGIPMNSSIEEKEQYIKDAKADLENHKKSKFPYDQEISKMQVNLHRLRNVDTTDFLDYQKADMAQRQRELEAQIKNMQTYKAINAASSTEQYYTDLENNVIPALEKQVELQKKEKTNLAALAELSPYAKILNEMEEYEKNLSELEDMKNARSGTSGRLNPETGEFEYDLLIDIDPSYRKMIDSAVEEIQNKLDTLKIKLVLEDRTDWQKALQDELGIDDKTMADMMTKGLANGAGLLKQWADKEDSELNLKRATDRALGVNKATTDKDYALQQLESMYKKYNNVMSMNSALKGSDKFGIQQNGELDKATAEIKRQFDDLKEKAASLGATTEEIDKALGNFNESLDDPAVDAAVDAAEGSGMGDIVKGQLSSLSGDISNFMQGFAQGGVWGGILNAVIGALVKVAGSCEGFEEAMNPITTWITELKPVIQVIINIAARFVSIVSIVFDAISELLSAASPLIDFIYTAIDSLKTPLLWIAIMLKSLAPLLNAFCTGLVYAIKFLTFGMVDMMAEQSKTLDEVYNSMDSFQDSVEESTENVRDLTSAYKSLLDAMRENEEWYIREKTGLNAASRRDSYQSVNDMILTPHGNFSTHPEDYIIATKNPAALGGASGGNVVFNMTVRNEMGNEAQVQVSRSPNGYGGQDFLVSVSRRIAADVADGANGWDSALDMRSVRMAGRKMEL